MDLDPEVTCVTLRVMPDFPDGEKLPPLPEALQRLVLPWVLSNDYKHCNGIDAGGTLGKLTSLRCLVLRPWGWDLDLSMVANPESLWVLELYRTEIADPRILRSFTGLRRLDLLDCKGMEDLSFATAMPRLRYLGLEHTEVTDLSPISGHAALEELRATEATIERLPERPLPALRRVTALDTKVPAEAWTRFAERHPDCLMQVDWESTLKDAIAGCDRIRLSRSDMFGPGEWTGEVRDPEQIRELIESIHVVPSPMQHGGRDIDALFFEFSRSTEVLALLLMKGTHTLRWEDGLWPGFATIKVESREGLCLWLARHGFPEELEQLKRIRDR